MFTVRNGITTPFELEGDFGVNGWNDIGVEVPLGNENVFQRSDNITIVKNRDNGNITFIANRDVPPPPTTLV